MRRRRAALAECGVARCLSLTPPASGRRFILAWSWRREGRSNSDVGGEDEGFGVDGASIRPSWLTCNPDITVEGINANLLGYYNFLRTLESPGQTDHPNVLLLMGVHLGILGVEDIFSLSKPSRLQ
ncbi:plant-specific domain TIGR01615 family protein [Musa troglodytarum]|uniref:Plant-specific domain TIGR01615 family protein n=1 Tax=Musa troglodytarum TaxID=320322 RepID=A0A9E7HAD4_9LILI|nr:plant-specific domain TIGR01615 family protein [Musa troglodytarum]